MQSESWASEIYPKANNIGSQSWIKTSPIADKIIPASKILEPLHGHSMRGNNFIVLLKLLVRISGRIRDGKVLMKLLKNVSNTNHRGIIKIPLKVNSVFKTTFHSSVYMYTQVQIGNENFVLSLAVSYHIL